MVPFPPAPWPCGRRRTTGLRRRVAAAAALCLLRAGRAWRRLPREFPPGRTAHRHLRAWRADGAWHRVHEALRRTVRATAGRAPGSLRRHCRRPDGQDGEKGDPAAATRAGASAAASASEAVPRTLVDGLGLLIASRAGPADLHDQHEAPMLPAGLRPLQPRLAVVCGDGAYALARRWRPGAGPTLASNCAWCRGPASSVSTCYRASGSSREPSHGWGATAGPRRTLGDTLKPPRC